MAQIRETELDVHALAGALWARAKLIGGLTVAAAVLTFVLLGFVDPLYTADTRILIEERESPLTRPRDVASGTQTPQYDESAIQSQVEVLRSREIADAVIDKLNLTRRQDFDPATQPSVISSLLVMLGLKEHPADATIRQRVMDTYYERISVYPIGRSRVIGVDFVAPDPELAAEVANAIAESFVDLQRAAKRQTAVAATDWLEQEIERLRSRVAEAEARVQQFRASADLFDTNQATGTLSTQQLTEINAELARAKAARSEAEARAQSVRALLQANGAIDSSPDVLNSQLIQRLSERQVALRSQIAELSTTLLPTHPRIRALNRQLVNLDAQARQEADKILNALNTAARIAAAREQSLSRSLDQAKVEVSRTNEQGIELRALEREAEAQRALLESFLGRYREAAARSDANYIPADARLISRAIAPGEPSFPKKGAMAIAAAIAMLLLASTVVMVREFTSGRAFRIVGSTDPYDPQPDLFRDAATSFRAAPAFVAAAAPERVPEPARAEIAPPVPLAPEPSAPPVAETEAAETPLAAGAGPAAVEAPVVVYDGMPTWDDDPPPAAAVEPERMVAEADDLAPASVIETDGSSPKVDGSALAEAGPFVVRADEDDPALSQTAGSASAVHPAAIPLGQADSGGGPATISNEADAAIIATASAEPDIAAPLILAAEPGIAPAGEDDVRTNAEPDDEEPGTAQLAGILVNPAARLVLFAGIRGGEGAGEVAYSSARVAAGSNLRMVLLDIGAEPAPALGGSGDPGLGDLLSGEAAFGEVIRRDEKSRVHIIPMGTPNPNAPVQRLEMVIGALTHSYDRVVVVADRLQDWPCDRVRPDLVALICGPDSSDEDCALAYDAAIRGGARTALIVRFARDPDSDHRESRAA